MKFKEFLIKEGVMDPGIFKAVFLAGGPGAGKSFVSKSAFAGTGLKFSNSDNIFTKYLSDAGLSLKMPENEKDMRDALRIRAKAKTATRADIWVKGRLGLVIDGTARDYLLISKQQRLLKFLGYDTHMIFINTTLEVALERNIERGRKGDRTVPEYATKHSWNVVQSNMGKFQSLFGSSNFHIIDNNKSEKELVTLTSRKAAGMARSMMSRPHNYIAKQWINKELELRKR